MSTKTIGTLMIVGGIFGIGVFLVLLFMYPRTGELWYLILTLYVSILMIMGGCSLHRHWTTIRNKQGIEHHSQGSSTKLAYRGLGTLPALLLTILILVLLAFNFLILLYWLVGLV